MRHILQKSGKYLNNKTLWNVHFGVPVVELIVIAEESYEMIYGKVYICEIMGFVRIF